MDKTLSAIHTGLLEPFDRTIVEVKPGAVARDKPTAMALAYVDARAYMARLDDLAGPEGWSVEYRSIVNDPDRDGNAIIAVFCRLTILGHVREDVGEAAATDANAATSAAMQAFKRACAAFGLGRYLYMLPQVWGAYDKEKKRFEHPDALVDEMYRKADLRTRSADRAPARETPEPTAKAETPAPRRDTVRSEAARRARGTPAENPPATNGTTNIPATTLADIRKGIAEVKKFPGGREALGKLCNRFKLALMALEDTRKTEICAAPGTGEQFLTELRSLYSDLKANRHVAA